MKEELENIENILSLDFGKDDMYAALLNECYSTNLDKYEYKFCPFDKTSQKEGHSSEVKMGKYETFGVEKDVNTGKNRLVMIFSNGDRCWNGPNRATNVQFKCAVESSISDIMEPSTCKYSMVFHTPMACTQAELNQYQYIIKNQFKDEL